MARSREAPISFRESQDAVIIRAERDVLGRIEAHAACVGVDQSRPVEAIAAHHAADPVREEFSGALRTIWTR